MDNKTTITRDRAEGVPVLRIEGDITGSSEDALSARHDEVLAEKQGGLILDLSGVDYINSAGIAVLIGFFVKAQQAEQKVVIVGLKPYFQKIFKMVGLNRFTTVVDQLEKALGLVR